MLVHRMVKKVKDSKVWAKINTRDESDRLESLKRQLAQAKQTGGDKDYEKELEDEIKELEAQYQREGLTKDADPRGYKVSDQIIKGFLIYKSGKGPATFFAKNENGKEFEGSMEEIKKQIDDYWVKQDEDVMKQKMKDGEKVDEGVYKGKKYWIKSAFPRITYRGYIQGVRGVICEEISLKNVEKGIFYYIDHQMGKDSNKTKDEVFTDPRYVIYHTKWKGLDISQLKDKTIVWENNRQLKSINGGDYDALAKAQDWIDAFRRKTKDARPKHPRWRIKDDKLFRLRSAIKKAKTKDVELSNRAVWRKEDFDKMVSAGNFTIVSKQPWGYEVKVKSGNIYGVEVKDSYTKGSADKKTKDQINPEYIRKRKILVDQLERAKKNRAPIETVENITDMIKKLDEDYDRGSAKDKYTGDPLTKKGQKIMAAMREKYGKKKGESVFYASKNKGTISGVDGKTRDYRQPKTVKYKGFEIDPYFGQFSDGDIGDETYLIYKNNKLVVSKEFYTVEEAKAYIDKKYK
jgi:hypothetical protein